MSITPIEPYFYTRTENNQKNKNTFIGVDDLNQKDVDLIFSHINSTSRKSLGFNTPYNVFKAMFGIKLLTILNIQEINKDEVHLKPSLLK